METPHGQRVRALLSLTKFVVASIFAAQSGPAPSDRLGRDRRRRSGDKPRLQRDYSAWLAAARAAPGEYPAYYHNYYDCNSYADHEIGRLLDAVDRYCPEALLIYTSDHGDHLGAFGLCAKGPTMYDHTVAVPLVVAGPGRPTPKPHRSPSRSCRPADRDHARRTPGVRPLCTAPCRCGRC